MFIKSYSSEDKTTWKTPMKKFKISPYGNLGKGKQIAENQNRPCCCC